MGVRGPGLPTGALPKGILKNNVYIRQCLEFFEEGIISAVVSALEGCCDPTLLLFKAGQAVDQKVDAVGNSDVEKMLEPHLAESVS